MRGREGEKEEKRVGDVCFDYFFSYFPSAGTTLNSDERWSDFGRKCRCWSILAGALLWLVMAARRLADWFGGCCG